MHLTSMLRSPQQQHAYELQVPGIWDADEQLRTCLHSQRQHSRTKLEKMWDQFPRRPCMCCILDRSVVTTWQGMTCKMVEQWNQHQCRKQQDSVAMFSMFWVARTFFAPRRLSKCSTWWRCRLRNCWKYNWRCTSIVNHSCLRWRGYT